MSWHIYLFWGFSTTTKPHVQLIIIPNNEYGKYYPGAAVRPEYGSVFTVSLPITGLLSSWSLDNDKYQDGNPSKASARSQSRANQKNNYLNQNIIA